jgi:tripartite-type tricarboxylate transporter receptor subunit TctC
MQIRTIPLASSVFAIATLCSALNASDPAIAQSYPNKPIKIIVPATPGGPLDMPARLAAQILPQKLGQPVVVEHRPGAGNVIGTREVAKVPPDGYTLLSGATGNLTVVPALSPSAGYDPTKDFVAIAKIMEAPQILVVHPSSPWKTVKDFVEYAKANPGKVNYAHTGTANIPHLCGELFMASAGVTLIGVPYRSGGDNVTAVLNQTVQLTFQSITILLPLIAEGKLRALAVTSRTRSPHAPNLPTMIEAGIPDYEVNIFFGIVAPAGTPAGIVNTLNATINDALKTADIQETINKLGAVPQLGSPDDFSATIAADLQKWRALGKAANITIE